MPMIRHFLALVLTLAAPLFPMAAEGELAPVSLRTNYQADSRYADVEQLLDRAAKHSHIRRMEFGKTVEGRNLSAVIIANPPVEKPADVRGTERLKVLLLGNIHSGECDGKEALLQLLAELAAQPDHPWLKDLVLIIAPNYNADGGERLGAQHRPGQNGPVLTGRRENAQDLDLNRDFIKLDAPETRGLVDLFNNWNPHIFIDCHTTNGSRHRYPITYDIPHHPAAPQAIHDYLRGSFMPAVTSALAAQGVPSYYYGNFSENHTRWGSFGYGGRFGTEYVGLRGRIAILAESYSYDDFPTRVSASRKFVSACMDFASAHRANIRGLLRETRRGILADGRPGALQDKLPLVAEAKPLAEKATVLGYEKNADGVESPKDYTVEVFAHYEPTISVPRAHAYIVPPQFVRAADRLRMHGLKVQRLTQNVEALVEVYKIQQVTKADEPYQGHHPVTLKAERREEQRTLSKGSFVISSNQPLGNLLATLLEPESIDGLATWNFFDSVIEQNQDYPILRVSRAINAPLEDVAALTETRALDVDQIFDPKRSIDLDGSASIGQRWQPESDSFLRKLNGTWHREEAATGAVTPLSLEKTMQDALGKLPEIGLDKAKEAADKADWNATADTAVVNFSGDLYAYRDGVAKRLTYSPQLNESIPSISPNGKFVAYVRNHNLYVAAIQEGREWALTVHGNENIFCGELDWVYQEELYGRGNFTGFWWSPNSDRIAFLEIDQTDVNRFTVVDHIPTRQNLEVVPYPKAGDSHPKARLGVVDVSGGNIRYASHEEYTAQEHLIVRVTWSKDAQRVVYQLQNRPQTWLDYRSLDPNSGNTMLLFREDSPAWVESLGDPKFLKDGRMVLLSDRSGERHVYLVSADGANLRPLTSGAWDVMELHGADEREEFVYFSGHKDTPWELHTYRVRLDGTNLERTTELGGWHTAVFNDKRTYFFDTTSNTERPSSTVLRHAHGPIVRTIAPNLTDQHHYVAITKPTFVQIPARDGHTLQGMLLSPPKSENSRRMPVLIYTYSGPQAAVVRNRWPAKAGLWHQLVVQKGCHVLFFDSRAAAGPGIKHAWPIHGKMGERELIDLEDAVTWLKARSDVDSARIGLWGWSYGGYMTCYALTHSTSFCCGISVAAVTDWRNYDTIYTERYMKLPQDNTAGYTALRLADSADKLHGDLLLVHGTMDDNVHLTNTLQFASALQLSGKSFEMMLYPGNRHSMENPTQTHHLRKLMLDFLERRLLTPNSSPGDSPTSEK